VPRYSQGQRDIVWIEAKRLFPAIAAIGRNAVNNPLIARGLKRLVKKTMAASETERDVKMFESVFDAEREGWSEDRYPQAEVTLPNYSRSQRFMIWGRAINLFPALEAIGRDTVTRDDVLLQALRLIVERVYEARAEQNARKGVRVVEASGEYVRFQERMGERRRQAA
jgi:hypothetical protein